MGDQFEDHSRYGHLPFLLCDESVSDSKDILSSSSSGMIGSSPHKLLYDKEESNLNLRLGVSFDLNKRGMVRVAYQRRSTPGFLGELEPIGCAGLIPPTFDIEFNEAQDVQGAWSMN